MNTPNILVKGELGPMIREAEQQVDALHTHLNYLLDQHGVLTPITHFESTFEDVGADAVEVQEVTGQVDHLAAKFVHTPSSGAMPGEMGRRDITLVLGDPEHRHDAVRIIHTRVDHLPGDRTEHVIYSDYFVEQGHAIRQYESEFGPMMIPTEYGWMMQELNEFEVSELATDRTNGLALYQLTAEQITLNMMLVSDLQSIITPASEITKVELYN